MTVPSDPVMPAPLPPGGAVCVLCHPVTGQPGPWVTHTTGGQTPVVRSLDAALGARNAAGATQLTDTVVAAVATHRRPVAVPFTIDNDTLVVGDPIDVEMTPQAAVRCAMALHDHPVVALDAAEVLALVDPCGLVDAGFSHLHQPQVLASGTAVSPGVGSGHLCVTVSDVVDTVGRGAPAVLAVDATTVSHEPAMRVAAAVVTTTGGTASHAAVLSRAWGVAAVCSVSDAHGPLSVTPDGLTDCNGNVVAARGSMVTVDGTRGVIAEGRVDPTGNPEPDGLGWLAELAATVCGDKVRVHANADTPTEVALACQLGAGAIGLCRTEHLLVGDNAAWLQAVVDAATEPERTRAIETLVAAHTDALEHVLVAAGDREVTIRLFDAPSHEFALASPQAGAGGPPRTEHNPMLGVRGARMAHTVPGVYEAQCQAVAAAVARRQRAGHNPAVRLLIPMVATVAEFAVVATVVRDTWADATGGQQVHVGVMVETPRAALVAGGLARHADFVSVGTNDLTQFVFAMSRDDLAALIDRYVAEGLMVHDPFRTLDLDGVGALVAGVVEAVTASGAVTDVGVCGEHAGDPRSVAALVAMGVTTLSCPPRRVAVARIAAARAVLGLSEPPVG